MKQRIDYLDVAKALLILCLTYGHLFLIARLQGINDDVNRIASSYICLYATFFMQAFFIITGLCSSFSLGFPSFLSKNIKTVLFPGIIITLLNRLLYNILPGLPFEHTPSFVEWFIDGGPWFIYALFFSKIVYWFICKCNLWKQLIIVIGGYIICLIMREYFESPNYICYQHTLLMLPYLFLGCISKKYLDRISSIMPIIAIGGAILLLLEYFLKLPMPTHDYNIGVTIRNFPVHIINVIAGTTFILWMSKLIKKNAILQLIGKGTLIIYLLNESVLKLGLIVIYPIYGISNLVFYFLSFILSIAVFIVLIRVVYGTKYLSWIVGKY